MIIIGILYGCIIGYEWSYLQRKKRKLSTFRYVLGTAALLFISFEALYYFREQFTMGEVIETVFGPIEKFMRMEK